MSRRTIVFLLLVVIAAIIVSVAIPRLILGKTIPQPKGKPYTNSVAQSISDVGGGNPLLQEGKNFVISSERYFDNKKWLVVVVSPVIETAADPAVIVMRYENNTYNAVVGPGTTFDNDEVSSLPEDVVRYLREQGRLSGQ